MFLHGFAIARIMPICGDAQLHEKPLLRFFFFFLVFMEKLLLTVLYNFVFSALHFVGVTSFLKDVSVTLIKGYS